MSRKDANTLRGEISGTLIFGKDGKSAYQLAVENGYEGTKLEWLESLDGKSAYVYAVENGYIGSEADFVKKMRSYATKEFVEQKVEELVQANNNRGNIDKEDANIAEVVNGQ